MKKRIVALIGALSLTFAMSLNVFAAGSVTSSNVADAVQDVPEVEVKEDKVVVTAGGVTAEININQMENDSYNVMDAFYSDYDWDNFDPQTYISINTITKVDAVVDVAKAVAKEIAAPTVLTDKVVTEVSKVIAVEITAPIADKSKPVVVTFDVKKLGLGEPADDNYKFLAIDGKDGGTKTFVGEYKDGKVTFSLDSFSPYAILMVKTESKPQSQPAYNPDWDPAVQAERKAAAQAEHEALWAAYLASGNAIPVVAIAPKTGDVAAMVSIMAVIFLGGAVTAVAMSRKRA